jgi:hypothetical protein
MLRQRRRLTLVGQVFSPSEGATMPRLPHGQPIKVSALRAAQHDVARHAAENALAFAAVSPPDLKDFDYMFPTLQDDPDALLPESAQTVVNLRRLAATMADDNTAPDSGIPAAYTYFGQFVDHDITLEAESGPATDEVGGLLRDNLAPLSLADVKTRIRNARTATLDLDSVYGFPAPSDTANPEKMLIGKVSLIGGGDQPPPFARPAGKGATTTMCRASPAATCTPTTVPR